MEFFGLTQYGASDPIKFLMRPDYKEPENPPNLLETLTKGKTQRPFAEAIRELDIYSGILDGYAYRSVHRSNKNKTKGFYKPVGPSDMYRGAITGSMDYGWWLTDPVLAGQTWYKPDCFLPIPSSETTRFINKALLQNKNFIL